MATTVYRLRDGTRVPSVTTVLAELNKPALVSWANKLGLSGIKVNEYRDSLADVGTAVHELAKSHLAAREPKLPSLDESQLEMATRSFEKFLAWSDNHEINPLVVERPLVSELHRYGGTPDALCVIDGRVCIVDFKTGRAVYDDFGFQVAGYEQLFSENGYPTVQKAVIVRIGRDEDEGFDVVEWGRSKLELYREVFLDALHIYHVKRVIDAGGDIHAVRAR
jgi:hypothetical protein